MEDGRDTRRDPQRLLVVGGAEVGQRCLGPGLVVERLLHHQVRPGRVAGHGRVVVRVAERRIAHACADALFVADAQLVHAGGDDAAVGQHVAGVGADRCAGSGVEGRGLVLPLGDLPLGLDRGLVALLLPGRDVGMPGGPVAVPLGVFLLELAGVEQDQRGQLYGAAGRIDGALEAFGDYVRNEAAMVEMGVGQDDCVQRGRVVGQGNAVAHDLVRAALEHAAIDQQPGPLRGEEELGSGNGVGSAEELDFHVLILPSRRVGRATLARVAATRRWSGRETAAYIG